MEHQSQNDTGRGDEMYPRVEYEMSERDLEKIMDACKPVPLIMLNIGMPRSQQENANDAWAELGKKLGFDPMTVQPINGKGNRFFTAVPSETETQKQERLKREHEIKTVARIKQLTEEILERKKELNALGMDKV